jgi:MFS family permease
VAIYSALGLAGLVLFGFARTSGQFYLAAFLCGVYAGAAFIYMVYHALMHPTKAGRYVGINEALVGLTGIIAPAAGGWLGQEWTLSMPYYAVAALVGAAMIAQVTVHLRLPRTA